MASKKRSYDEMEGDPTNSKQTNHFQQPPNNRQRLNHNTFNVVSNELNPLTITIYNESNPSYHASGTTKNNESQSNDTNNNPSSSLTATTDNNDYTFPTEPDDQEIKGNIDILMNNDVNIDQLRECCNNLQRLLQSEHQYKYMGFSKDLDEDNEDEKAQIECIQSFIPSLLRHQSKNDEASNMIMDLLTSLFIDKGWIFNPYYDNFEDLMKLFIAIVSEKNSDIKHRKQSMQIIHNNIVINDEWDRWDKDYRIILLLDYNLAENYAKIIEGDIDGEMIEMIANTISVMVTSCRCDGYFIEHLGYLTIKNSLCCFKQILLVLHKLLIFGNKMNNKCVLKAVLLAYCTIFGQLSEYMIVDSSSYMNPALCQEMMMNDADLMNEVNEIKQRAVKDFAGVPISDDCDILMTMMMRRDTELTEKSNIVNIMDDIQRNMDETSEKQKKEEISKILIDETGISEDICSVILSFWNINNNALKIIIDIGNVEILKESSEIFEYAFNTIFASIMCSDVDIDNLLDFGLIDFIENMVDKSSSYRLEILYIIMELLSIDKRMFSVKLVKKILSKIDCSEISIWNKGYCGLEDKVKVHIMPAMHEWIQKINENLDSVNDIDALLEHASFLDTWY